MSRSPTHANPKKTYGRLTAVLAGVLLLTTVMPVTAAEGVLPPTGMSIKDIPALKSAGAAPRYGSYWVGEWMAHSGWAGFDKAMMDAKAAGVTPVVYWYYWGDSISPSCVNNGCNSRDRAEWASLTNQLADHLRSTLGGSEVLIVLENEFNKNDISGSYASTFDAKLEGVAKTLKAVSGVKIVAGFGNWGESEWSKFPKTIAQSEYVGFQMMRASTKDSEASYRAAADRTVFLTNFVSEKFNKPSFLYDVALSSYPDARWATIQEQTLAAIFAKLTTSGATGLQGIVYRSLNDHYMSPSNYYGYAESHWGLRTSSGAAKPALNVWLKYAKADGSAPAPSPSPTPTPPPSDAFSVSFERVKGNAYWVQTSAQSSQSIAAVCAKVDGGSCRSLAKQSYGWASSFYVPDGSTVVFEATNSAGATASSGSYTWPDATPTGSSPSPTPPSTGFSATFHGVKGNAYWVQTSVSSSQTVSAVCAMIDDGACKPLDKKAYGWAKSFYVPQGSKVVFRATGTGGATATSGVYTWPDATPAGSAPTSSPSTAPQATVSFAPYGGNEWWVQTRVSSSQHVRSMCASVDGGTCHPLEAKSWGAWATSTKAPKGAKVVFHADLADGTTATSATYTWPVA